MISAYGRANFEVRRGFCWWVIG